MKRRYNYRLIRSHRPYTKASFAALHGVSEATVKVWIVNHGLSSAVTSSSRPLLLDGGKAKAWMKEWQNGKKQKCALDEMYCVRCKQPRNVDPQSFTILPSNTQKIIGQGECVECELTLNSFNTRSNADDLWRRFGPKGCAD